MEALNFSCKALSPPEIEAYSSLETAVEHWVEILSSHLAEHWRPLSKVYHRGEILAFWPDENMAGLCLLPNPLDDKEEEWRGAIKALFRQRPPALYVEMHHAHFKTSDEPGPHAVVLADSLPSEYREAVAIYAVDPSGETRGGLLYTTWLERKHCWKPTGFQIAGRILSPGESLFDP